MWIFELCIFRIYIVVAKKATKHQSDLIVKMSDCLIFGVAVIFRHICYFSLCSVPTATNMCPFSVLQRLLSHKLSSVDKCLLAFVYHWSRNLF